MRAGLSQHDRHFPFWKTLLGYGSPDVSDNERYDAYNYLRIAYIVVFSVCVLEFAFWGNFFWTMTYDYILSYYHFKKSIPLRYVIQSVLAIVSVGYCFTLFAWIVGDIYPISIAITRLKAILDNLGKASNDNSAEASGEDRAGDHHSGAAATPATAAPAVAAAAPAAAPATAAAVAAPAAQDRHTQRTNQQIHWQQVAVLVVTSLVVSLLSNKKISTVVDEWLPNFDIMNYAIYVAPAIIIALALIFPVLIGALDVAILLSPLKPIPEWNYGVFNEKRQRICALIVFPLCIIAVSIAIAIDTLGQSMNSMDPGSQPLATIVSHFIYYSCGGLACSFVFVWLIANHEASTTIPLLLRIPVIMLIAWVTSRLTDPIAFYDSIQERHYKYESEKILARMYDRFLEIGSLPASLRTVEKQVKSQEAPEGKATKDGNAQLDSKEKQADKKRNIEIYGKLRFVLDECLKSSNSICQQLHGTECKFDDVNKLNADIYDKMKKSESEKDCTGKGYQLSYAQPLTPSFEGCQEYYANKAAWDKRQSCISQLQQLYYDGVSGFVDDKDECKQFLTDSGVSAGSVERAYKGKTLPRRWGPYSCRARAQVLGLQLVGEICARTVGAMTLTCQRTNDDYKKLDKDYQLIKPFFLGVAIKINNNRTVGRDELGMENPENTIYTIPKYKFITENASWRARLCNDKETSIDCIEHANPDVQKKLQYYHEIKHYLIKNPNKDANRQISQFQTDQNSDKDKTVSLLNSNPTLLQDEITLWDTAIDARKSHLAELAYIMLIVGGLGELIVLLMKFFMPGRVKRYLAD